jgi:hypothetical protein
MKARPVSVGRVMLSGRRNKFLTQSLRRVRIAAQIFFETNRVARNRTTTASERAREIATFKPIAAVEKCHPARHIVRRRRGRAKGFPYSLTRRRSVAYTRTRVRAGFIIDATVLTELDACTRASHLDNSTVSTKTSSASVIDRRFQSR